MNARQKRALASRYCHLTRWYFDRIVLWDDPNQREVSIPLPRKVQEAMKSAYFKGKEDALKKVRTALRGD